MDMVIEFFHIRKQKDYVHNDCKMTKRYNMTSHIVHVTIEHYGDRSRRAEPLSDWRLYPEVCMPLRNFPEELLIDVMRSQHPHVPQILYSIHHQSKAILVRPDELEV